VHLDINIPPRVEYGNKVKGAFQTLNPTNYKKNSTLEVLVYDKDFACSLQRGLGYSQNVGL